MVEDKERQGRLMELKEQVSRDEYVVDVDAVAAAIVRRLMTGDSRVPRSEDVLEAAKAFGSALELHT